MTNRIAVFAASVPLMLTAAGVFGGEPQFQTPTTDRAQQTQSQLSRAARAVHDKVASTAGNRISNLWLYPTGDDHTVFAQYDVTSDRNSSNGGAAQKHLELLQLQGDRVVEERDLTRMGDDSTLRARQDSGGRDRSDSQGSTQRSKVARNATESQAARAHWTSKIGTARALDSNINTQNGKSSQ